MVIIYSIKTVAEKYDVTYDTLRYYEKIGLIQDVKRNSQGQREYSDANLNSLNKIIHLRSLGASIADCQQFNELLGDTDITADDYEQGLKLLDKLEDNLNKRIATIEQQKQFLAEKKHRFTKERDILLQNKMNGEEIKL